MLHGDCHGRGEIQHVHCAAAPHHAVDELAAEGIVSPPVGVDRDDVGVAEQQERGCGWVRSLDAGDQVVPARRRLVALQLQSGALQIGFQQRGAANLPPRLGPAVVHASIADELLQKVRDLSGRVRHFDPVLSFREVGARGRA